MRSTNFFKSLLLTIFFILVCSVISQATHLRAGEIVVERISCSSLTFRITVTVFTNTLDTPVLFGGEDDILDFGDGNRILVPETPNTIRQDLGIGIATASFTILHTYSGYESFIISYSEPNRNKGVVNMDGSVNTRFYIETRINVDPFLGCNNTPKLLVPPIDRACTGVAFFHNPGAFDPDGDSLSYELVIPFRDKGTTVVNYKDPSDPKFYTNYQQGNELANGPPSFRINPTDGTLVWDAPGSLMVGEYNVAFIVVEWRKIAGQWRNMGFVRRDMQIIVEECNNDRPDLIVPKDVCVVAGTTLTATIKGIDPNQDNVTIEAFSEIFNFADAQSPATYTSVPNQSSVPEAELEFNWNTECIHVKEQPYQVVFKITDHPENGPKLVTFKTWFIRVVGPEPVWIDAETNLANRTISLEWDKYICENATSMQIWRKVDSFVYEPDSCQTGMPEFLGYSLIETVPLNTGSKQDTTYVDTNADLGVADGAQYCYRLVAIYPLPKGGESYVSDEICVDPIRADAPVITNVTIDKTDNTDGQITVRWTKPFDIDRTQYPGPFEYEVYRSEGFAGITNIGKVSGSGRLSEDDTTFVDQGMNTRDIIYNYRVVLWSNTATSPGTYTSIDTSFSASTVRLAAKSEVERITLSWSAFVPWSNQIQTIPNEHILYRGPAGSDASTMQEIAQINPTASGFTYIDDNLDNAEEYCYRIMTRGAYGNPAIDEPLENFSQIICAQPNDSIPPSCTPVLSVTLSDCPSFLADAPCNQSTFSNNLFWGRNNDDCGQDILGYKIYRASRTDGKFEWLVNAGVDGIVRDTSFVDNGNNNVGLSSLAYCYKISVIDLSGNESEQSEAVCNDNCPYYELPNIFTPNGDGCNDTFGAWRDPSFYESDGEENPVQFCGDTRVASGKCARFVEAVTLHVYNRWGKEVYTYRSGGERSIYIDWNGRGNDGGDLASGIYYYSAEVTFTTVDPKKRNQIVKGWVHLVR